ncbi:anti-sigma factor domain-containing protein [Streptomyces sp. NPDC008150]|uniref:anti-sigma factor n=1 Tax=Streptomyces sp. NPDC008150 TaxID=3364816 RepID=UPI0036ECEB58
MTTVELHTLTGAYALHALGDDERREFEAHLGECDACAQEVRELTATAARLGSAVAAEPRPEMRQQVLQRITAVRQDGPRTAPGARGRGGPGRARRLPRFALAACLAAAVGLGGVAVWQHQRAEDARQQAESAEQRVDSIAAVLSAPDAKTSSGPVARGGTGTVVVSQSRDQAVFVGAGLKTPAVGKVYQLWFDDDGTMRPAGLLNAGRATDAVLMDGKVGVASAMGITVEPAGGSKEPTSAPVALIKFSV